MTVHYLFQDHSFDAAATQVMGDAFDQACRVLGEFGKSAVLREVMAKQIVESAKRGERDSGRLCELALKALTVQPVAIQIQTAAKARTVTTV